MSIHKEKANIRRQIKELQKQYTAHELKQKSNTILSVVESLDVFKQANTVLVYWSLPDEVFTHDFAVKWTPHKTILLPAIKNNKLEIRRFTCHEDLREGAFCISEPCTDCHTLPADLAIIPGVAFNSEGNRLGRGKGFYDKFLAGFDGYKIGICFDFQLINSIPTEDFDIKMDQIISD